MRQFSVRLTVFILLLFRHARDWRFDVAARKTVTHEGRNRVMEVENIGVVDLSSQPLYLQAEVDRFALPLIRELLKGLHLLATIFEHSGVCAHLLANVEIMTVRTSQVHSPHSGGEQLGPCIQFSLPLRSMMGWGADLKRQALTGAVEQCAERQDLRIF